MRVRSLLIPGIGILAACAHAPPPAWAVARASSDDTFHLQQPAGSWGVKITSDEMLGVQPDFAVSRADHELRGQALGIPIIVGFHAQHGAGIFLGSPFASQVERRATSLVVTTLLGGTGTELELSPDHLAGRVGDCAWALRWSGSAYVGSRQCGGRTDPITVELPATFAFWPDTEMGSALALLLSRDPPRAPADPSAFRTPPVAELEFYYQLAHTAATSTVPRAYVPGPSQTLTPPSRPQSRSADLRSGQ